MTSELATTQDLSHTIMESVLLSGDLAKLTPADRVRFYTAVCESLKLNPLTRPFQYIMLNGKLTLYASRECTEQLRVLHGISVSILKREVTEGVYVVTARATDRSGRQDESIGCVAIDKLTGESRSNAMMKAETKAKRRVTLSISGLGMTDASETETIPNAQRVEVADDGKILDAAPAPLAITDGTPKLKPVPQEKPKERRKGDWYEIMLQGFAEIKTEIGDAEYYRILGGSGYEHANEIPDRKTAMQVYKDMAEVRKAKQFPEDVPQ